MVFSVADFVRSRQYPRSFMLDIIFIAAGIAFFLLTSAYAEGCDRL